MFLIYKIFFINLLFKFFLCIEKDLQNFYSFIVIILLIKIIIFFRKKIFILIF